TAAAVAGLIAAGRVRAAHDCSDGGLLVAAAEMAMAGGLGLDLAGIDRLPGPHAGDVAGLFSEEPSRYLLEVAAADADAVVADLGATLGAGLAAVIGTFDDTARVRGAGFDCPIGELMQAWTGTLDW
ncbi:MAG: AIR synthase-related protein, partial [Planctomycetota bacterium]